MKIFNLILLFTLLSFLVNSQEFNFPIDSETGEICYTDVVQVDGTNSETLFTRAREWFAYSFKSAQNVIQMEDKEAGKLIGKGASSVTIKAMGGEFPGGYIDFTVSIQVKDGRYKYDLTDFKHNAAGTDLVTPGDLRVEKPGGGLLTMGKKNWKNIKMQAHLSALSLIESLKTSMSSDSKQDDW